MSEPEQPDHHPPPPDPASQPLWPDPAASVEPRRTVRSRPTLLLALAGLVVVGLLGLVAAGVFARGGGEPDARATLDRARRFIRDARSVRYRQVVGIPGLPPGAQMRADAEARFPDRAHVTLDYGGRAAEVVIDGRAVYVRDAGSRSKLEDREWQRADRESTTGDPDPGFIIGSGSETGADSLRHLIGRGTRPEVVDWEDETVQLRVHLRPRDLSAMVGDGSAGLQVVTGVLTIGPDGEPQRFVVEGTGKRTRVRSAVTVQEWDRPVAIRIPARSEVNENPDVDRRAVDAFREVPLLAPAAIPTGWRLTYADRISDADSDSGCNELTIGFEDPERADEYGDSYLDLYEYLPACKSDPPDDATIFAPGGAPGWIAEDDGAAYGQITVGRTLVEFDSDLSAADATVILARLVPLDVDHPPPATLPIGGSSS